MGQIRTVLEFCNSRICCLKLSTGIFTILALIVNFKLYACKKLTLLLKLFVILAQCRYTKTAQRIFKYSGTQYTILLWKKLLNSLVYWTLFYVNIYGSHKLLKTVWFLAHPVCVENHWICLPLLDLTPHWGRKWYGSNITDISITLHVRFECHISMPGFVPVHVLTPKNKKMMTKPLAPSLYITLSTTVLSDILDTWLTPSSRTMWILIENWDVCLPEQNIFSPDALHTVLFISSCVYFLGYILCVFMISSLWTNLPQLQLSQICRCIHYDDDEIALRETNLYCRPMRCSIFSQWRRF